MAKASSCTQRRATTTTTTTAVPQRLHCGTLDQNRNNIVRVRVGRDYIRLLANVLHEKNRRAKASKTKRNQDCLKSIKNKNKNTTQHNKQEI
jgi:hypothetical protein